MNEKVKIGKLMTLLILLSSISFAADPTYTKDVKPIFANRCSKCHDYLKGKNWQIYEDAYNERAIIRIKMITKEMPAGGVEMLQSERDLIISWVDKGAKK